ncbi:MDIS1-interacting receptor like kinase 2-like [Magnolia sinica]|uniref:MDIS1-interacting receptor like kinase 2-like n=1 Tax=Magnolia sinica TaxID=86752 RepID=UPI00265B597C|nr:MDIS1-interacting receptor like kinase 2-like [Magnolia sinica]
MTNLSHLCLDGNNFSGYLPQLCHGGSLQVFAAPNNHFTGVIPTSLRNCTSLTKVRLDGNRLTANVSEAFGVYPHLTFMDVSDNMLFGELSPNWGECQNLTKLQFSGNVITGRIPPEIGQLLSGQVPQEIGKLSNLEELDLSMNRFSGPIPPQLGDCYKLEYLKLSENVLNGSIPFEIGRLSDSKALQKAPPEAFIENKGLCGEVQDIVEAVEGFDEKYCIETGGYEKVYKANIPTGHVLAVKKLHPTTKKLTKGYGLFWFLAIAINHNSFATA